MTSDTETALRKLFDALTKVADKVSELLDEAIRHAKKDNN